MRKARPKLFRESQARPINSPATNASSNRSSWSSNPDRDDVTLTVRSAGAEHKILCGRGKWEMGRLVYGMFPEQPAAASGGWSDGETFVAKICFYETPFCVTMTLKFTGDQVQLDSRSNLGFGSTEQPRLVGKNESD